MKRFRVLLLSAGALALAVTVLASGCGGGGKDEGDGDDYRPVKTTKPAASADLKELAGKDKGTLSGKHRTSTGCKEEE